MIHVSVRHEPNTYPLHFTFSERELAAEFVAGAIKTANVVHVEVTLP